MTNTRLLVFNQHMKSVSGTPVHNWSISNSE